MTEKKYTEDHEWIHIDGDTATVGITNHAQESLGDIVFIDLPTVGKVVKAKDELCVIESVKAASDIYSPVDGEVSEINEKLKNEKINKNNIRSTNLLFHHCCSNYCKNNDRKSF